MIRGSIEVTRRDRVAGWVFSSAASVRGHEILAFIDGRCVGAGTVDRFRQDLFDAGLGDGYCGFDFQLNLQDTDALGAVVVRLAGSDASLLQPATKLTGPEDETIVSGEPDLGAIAPASVVWMQDRGMLEQHEYDFLRGVQTLGAYERGLRAARRLGNELQANVKPDVAAAEMLGLFTLSEVSVRPHRVGSISDLAGEDSVLRASKISVVALWAEERGRITLDERSHAGEASLRRQILSEPPLGGIDYNFGPDRLLFLHRDCSFAPAGPAPAQGIVVYVATPRVASLVTRRPRAA